MRSLLTCLVFLLSGCYSPPTPSYPSEWEEIQGRDDIPLPRSSLYRASIPTHWEREEVVGSVSDTRKPIVTFWIHSQKPDCSIRITVHNFPVDRPEQRIPPMAQIQRWKQQAKQIDTANFTLIPYAHGGFFGYFMLLHNLLEEESTTTLGWAMQLAPAHARVLSDKQMLADYTIKAHGPSSLLQQHQEEIKLFARSFELIQEIREEL